MWKWTKRIVLGTLALVVIAIATVLIVIHTDWGRDLLRRRIETALAASFPGGAHVGKLEGSAFGELVVRDLELDRPDHTPEVRVKEARIELSLWALTSSVARIDRLVIDGVEIDVPERTEPAKPTNEPPSPPTWSIQMRDFAIHHAKVTRGNITVGELEIVGSVLVPASGVIDATVAARGVWEGHAIDALAVARYTDGAIDVPLAIARSEGARVVVTGVHAIGTDVDGTVAVTLPVAAAKALGDVELPGDASVVVDSLDGQADIDVRVGPRHVGAIALFDQNKLTANSVAIIEDPDGTAVATVDASMTGIRGMITATSHGASGVIAVDSSWSGGQIIAGGEGAGVHAGVYAQVRRTGATWEVTKSRVVARATKVGDATGTMLATATATGRAWPDWDVRVNAHADAHSITYAGKPIGSAGIDASSHVRKGQPIVVDLVEHHVEPVLTAPWTGHDGMVVVDGNRIELRGFKSASGPATVVADATFDKASKDLTAELDAQGFALAAFAVPIPGVVSVNATVKRVHGTWSGDAKVAAHGVAVRGVAGDGTATIAVRGRRIDATVAASGGFGGANVVASLDGPRELTDPLAWRALTRRDLRSLTIELPGVHLAALDPKLSGDVSGQLAMTATTSRGELHLRGLHQKPGDISADVTLVDLHATAIAHLADLARADATAELALPARIFDPAAWRTLGRGVLRGAEIHGAELAFDPSLLGRFGIDAPYRGRAVAAATISEAAATISATAELHDVRGGALVKPVDAKATATVDGKGLTASALASAGTRVLAELTAHSPITLDTAAAYLAQPITGTVAIPIAPAPELLAIFGRSDVLAGTVEGTVTLAGTFGVPTAMATVTARDVQVPQSLSGRKAPVLEQLAVLATWNGADGTVDVTGREVGGGTLHVAGSGNPKLLSSVAVQIDAHQFDLSPAAPFAPGPLVAASGTLDAKLAIRGLDPATGDAHGELHLVKARMPLTDVLGTLRQANLDATIANHIVDAKLSGKLGGGTIQGNGKLALVGATPSHGELSLSVRNVAPVGTIEPQISADITASVAYAGQWTGTATVRHGVVTVPDTQRDALLEAGTPSDMTFADRPPPVQKTVRRVGPAHPWLVVETEISPVSIDAENLRDVGSGHVVVAGKLKVSIGDGVGLDGELDAERGDIGVLGRSYQLDHARLVFDGSTDPLLDVRMVHDFQEAALMAVVHGRASLPILELQSDPAIYNDSQLLGFFLGGEPGGDPSAASRDAAQAAAGSYVSSMAGQKTKKFLKNNLPFLHADALDVLTYDTGTSESSGAVRAGVWITRKLFVQYRGHPGARPDENSNEGEVEWYFLRNWILQLSGGDHGVGGLDAVHRWRW